MKCKSYCSPVTLKEALELAADKSQKTIFVAGGTDVFVKARGRDWYNDYTLIDLGNIKELKHILDRADEIEIGSCVKLSDICNSHIINTYLPILSKSCSVIGSPQIRNQGTIGGNIGNACLAGDALPALCVLGAKLKIINNNEERIVPIDEIFKACPACLGHEGMCVRDCYYGIPTGKKTSLGEEDLIFSIIIPKQESDEVYFYKKVGQKEALSMSKFTLAIRLKSERNYVKALRISIGAALDKLECEDDICKDYTMKFLDKKDIKELSERLSEKILSTKKGTKDILYKSKVCERLINRTLKMLVLGDEENT